MIFNNNVQKQILYVRIFNFDVFNDIKEMMIHEYIFLIKILIILFINLYLYFI